jgi:CubicO group peptidase (beta-lactamase class C family)
MMNKKELALVFEQLEKEHRFSGTLLVAQDGEVVFEKAYGFASRQLNVPNVLETKFHIASVTKMFIAMAALILSERGRISLHEKPVTYVPELAALDKDITLHHLLSHTSGLQDIYDVPNLRFEMRIAPRVILPIGKKMRTNSVPWGKIIHGGTRGGEGGMRLRQNIFG